MSTDIKQLVGEAKGWVSYKAVADHAVSAHDTIRRLADALEREHQRAESLRIDNDEYVSAAHAALGALCSDRVEYVVRGYHGQALYFAPSLDEALRGIEQDRARSEQTLKRTVDVRTAAGPWQQVWPVAG